MFVILNQPTIDTRKNKPCLFQDPEHDVRVRINTALVRSYEVRPYTTTEEAVKKAGDIDPNEPASQLLLDMGDTQPPRDPHCSRCCGSASRPRSRPSRAGHRQTYYVRETAEDIDALFAARYLAEMDGSDAA